MGRLAKDYHAHPVAVMLFSTVPAACRREHVTCSKLGSRSSLDTVPSMNAMLPLLLLAG